MLRTGTLMRSGSWQLGVAAPLHGPTGAVSFRHPVVRSGRGLREKTWPGCRQGGHHNNSWTLRKEYPIARRALVDWQTAAFHSEPPPNVRYDARFMSSHKPLFLGLSPQTQFASRTANAPLIPEDGELIISSRAWMPVMYCVSIGRTVPSCIASKSDAWLRPVTLSRSEQPRRQIHNAQSLSQRV